MRTTDNIELDGEPMIDRNDYDKALLKCLEALSSMVALVAVIVDDGRMSEQEGRAFNREYSKWNAAHQNLMRAMKDDEL